MFHAVLDYGVIPYRLTLTSKTVRNRVEVTQMMREECTVVGYMRGKTSQFPKGLTAKVICAVVVLAAILPAGCGSSSTGAMSGTWAFALATTQNYILATADLKQSGNQISGSATVTGAPTGCGSTATMTGTVQGNNLSLQIADEGAIITLNGQANTTFTAASGTYEVISGSCVQNGDMGNWTAQFE